MALDQFEKEQRMLRITLNMSGNRAGDENRRHNGLQQLLAADLTCIC
jgi:hypothetical protein